MNRSRDNGALAVKVEAMQSDIAVLKAQIRHLFWAFNIQIGVLATLLLKLFGFFGG